MIPQATKDKLKALGIDPDALIEAVKADEEKDITIPEGEFFTTEQLTARDEVKIREGKKAGEAEGETKGKELAIKALKKEFGVEFDGKELSKLTEAVKSQLSKGDEGLKEQIRLLQNAVTEKDNALAAEQTKAQQAIREAGLLAKLPANKSKTLSNEEHLMLVKANLEFTDEGVKYKGQILRDSKTQNPLDEDAAINFFYNERKLVDAADPLLPPGRGGMTKLPATKPTKVSEYLKQLEEQGKSLTSEIQAELLDMVTKGELEPDSVGE